MYGIIIGAIVIALMLSLVLRICMISLRKNIILNEKYVQYIEEHKEAAKNLNEVPEVYYFSEYDFIKDFRINSTIVREAIWDREYLLLLILNSLGLSFIFLKINHPVYIFTTVLVLEALILLSLVDMEFALIPDSAHIIILAASLLMMLLPESISWSNRLLGVLIGGGFFWILNLLGGMGGGDVKLMAVAGFWMGYPRIIIAMLVGIFCAAIAGVLLIIMKKKTRKDPIAFGPYLSFGIIIAAIFYADIIKLFI
jgi:leader peptidase (prepilin peptidase)/N-methyltransferase